MAGADRLIRCFTEDSYGYRPGKSAHDALAKARQRCWAHDWVLDLDIKSFFDEIDWSLLMRAVRRHTDCPWVLLYLERWLRAPVSMPDGTLVEREKRDPAGGCRQSRAGESLSSLCVRSLDAAGIPDHPVRTLR